MIKVLTKREKLILNLTVAVFIFAIFFNFIIAPLFARNAALNKEISVYRGKLRKYVTLLSNKEAIENKSSSRFIAPEASSETSLVAALSQLEELAGNAGIRLIDIRPQAASRAREVTVDLRAQGTLDGLMKFIYNVETSLALFEIKRFQFTSRAENTNLEAIFSISLVALE